MASLKDRSGYEDICSKNNPADIAIVGAGPAGLTATIYALRDNKNVILFDKDEIGGQILNSPKVTNILGFAEISGFDFIENVKEQIESIESGTLNFFNEEVVDIVRREEIKGDTVYSWFEINTLTNTYYSRSVIAATGSKYRTLGVLGEEELIGEGISFCSTCDAPFYKDKIVAVIGGGNSALTEALEISKFAKCIYVLQDLPYLTAEKSLQDAIMSDPKIIVWTNMRVKKFLKEKGQISIAFYEKIEGNPEGSISVDGVFEAIGMIPQNKCFRHIADLTGPNNDDGYILKMNEGAMGAGDCVQKQTRQVATACGDGANAAVMLCRELENK